MPRVKTIAITRPREDAEQLAAKFKVQGYSTFIVPMLTIEPVEGSAQALGAVLRNQPPQLICVTSRHAVRMLAQQPYGRDIPLCAVGDATAAEAINAGFSRVSDAGGTARAMQTYVTEHYNPEHGGVLYARGKHISFNLAAEFGKVGLRTHEVITYDAQAVNELPQEYCTALGEGKVDEVIFYSRRSAETYVRLIKQQGLESAHKSIAAITMSEAVAQPLYEIHWCGISTGF